MWQASEADPRKAVVGSEVPVLGRERMMTREQVGVGVTERIEEVRSA